MKNVAWLNPNVSEMLSALKCIIYQWEMSHSEQVIISGIGFFHSNLQTMPVKVDHFISGWLDSITLP